MVEEIKQSWKENKLIMSICAVVITGLMAWGIWVTKGVFAATFSEITLKVVCDDIDRMKKIDEALKLHASVLEVKFENQTLKMEMNQKEIMQNQVDIMKALRKK